jgi:nickel-dependent lactate racemase
LATLKQHHGFNLRSDKPAMGWVEGNKFHENALEAARMAKVDFILNTVQNQHKEITQVVAGDVEKAWLFSKCLKRADLILVGKKIDDKTLKEMFTQRADTVEEAVAMALAKHGENAKIILMKNGSDMIPLFEGKPENA